MSLRDWLKRAYGAFEAPPGGETSLDGAYYTPPTPGQANVRTWSPPVEKTRREVSLPSALTKMAMGPLGGPPDEDEGAALSELVGAGRVGTRKDLVPRLDERVMAPSGAMQAESMLTDPTPLVLHAATPVTPGRSMGLGPRRVGAATAALDAQPTGGKASYRPPAVKSSKFYPPEGYAASPEWQVMQDELLEKGVGGQEVRRSDLPYAPSVRDVIAKSIPVEISKPTRVYQGGEAAARNVNYERALEEAQRQGSDPFGEADPLRPSAPLRRFNNRRGAFESAAGEDEFWKSVRVEADKGILYSKPGALGRPQKTPKPPPPQPKPKPGDEYESERRRQEKELLEQVLAEMSLER